MGFQPTLPEICDLIFQQYSQPFFDFLEFFFFFMCNCSHSIWSEIAVHTL